MKAGQLFRKTMPFAIAKLVLGAATILMATSKNTKKSTKE